MKRRFRILRIWYYGKLSYAKRVRKRIINEEKELLMWRMDATLKVIIEKYGDKNFVNYMYDFPKKINNHG